MNKREHLAYRTFSQNLSKVLLPTFCSAKEALQVGQSRYEVLLQSPQPLSFLWGGHTVTKETHTAWGWSVVWDVASPNRCLRSGFHKKLAGATSDRTYGNTKSLKEVSLQWAKVQGLLNQRRKLLQKLHLTPKLTYTGDLLWQSHGAVFYQRLCTQTHIFICETQGLYEDVKALNILPPLNRKMKIWCTVFNWVWGSSPSAGYSLKVTWMKISWFIKYHIPRQTLHRSQASLAFHF